MPSATRTKRYANMCLCLGFTDCLSDFQPYILHSWLLATCSCTPNLGNLQMMHSHSLTCCQLHPPADLIHSGCTAEEEEGEGADAGEDQHHGHPNEEGRSFEGARRDGAKLCEGPLARQVPGYSVPYAVVKEAKVAGLWRCPCRPRSSRAERNIPRWRRRRGWWRWPTGPRWHESSWHSWSGRSWLPPWLGASLQASQGS